MKLLIAMCALVALCAAAPANYQLPDGQAVVASQARLDKYVACLLDESKCAPEARPLRNQVPEALKTACAACTPEQKQFIRITTKHLIQHRPEDWKKIQAHFDQKGEHTEKFRKFLAASN
ncbi:ejaculatory bulb-specific protein 3-like [Bacillus rossius redtenbacheri]|uniref:ejaculatory bulb-specific protein 3-like n=1 Tax=Bacillus rossius redtenbacheri TaxID=93214 RepID=UPI002FDE7792